MSQTDKLIRDLHEIEVITDGIVLLVLTIVGEMERLGVEETPKSTNDLRNNDIPKIGFLEAVADNDVPRRAVLLLRHVHFKAARDITANLGNSMNFEGRRYRRKYRRSIN